MDPPGAILQQQNNNTVTQDIVPPQSPSPRYDDDAEGSPSEQPLSSSDPLQSHTSANTDSIIPKVSSSAASTPQITHIDDETFGPRFKDQTNSVAYGESSNTNRNGSSNRRPAAQIMPVVPRNFDNPTASSKQDNGPSYKDQVNASSNEVFLTSNRSSNPAHTNHSNNSNSLPIVHGVLIPPEMLTDEERRTSGQEMLGSGSDPQTAPVTTSLNVPATESDHRSNPPDNVIPTKKAVSPPISSSSDEQFFWMKIIFGAIVLNTFLVAAVIVGTFCGIGLCAAGSSSASNDNLPNFPTLAPGTMPPTKVPTSAPLPLLSFTLQPGTTASPTAANTASFTIVTTSSVPSMPPSMAPSFIPLTMPIENDTKNRSPHVIVFIIPAVVLEFILVLTCLYYYYQRKKKKLRQLNTGSEELPENVESGILESNHDDP